MSVSPRMFLRVKQTVRALKHETMKKIVAKAVTCSESDEIRRLLEQGS
jgi:phosphoenolpyruvate-protein kinase (PTS system EI component)